MKSVKVSDDSKLFLTTNNFLIKLSFQFDNQCLLSKIIHVKHGIKITYKNITDLIKCANLENRENVQC